MQQWLLVLSGQRRVPWRQALAFIRKSPEVFLLSTFDLARPPVPDVLVLLDEDPARAMERRRASGDRLETWEHEAFLQSLREGYRAVAELLRRRRSEVLTFDPTVVGANEIAQAAEAACRRRAFVDTGVAAES